MEQDIQTHAIVITSIPYKDYDRIVSAFSQERGFIKLYVKGANRPRSRRLAFCQPLTHALYTLTRGRGEFYYFNDGQLINAHLPLRDSYKHLKSAFNLVKALSKIHVEEHPSKDLFALLKSYLAHLMDFKEPEVLVSSFYLKVLLYEGCLSLNPLCARCQKRASPLYFYLKEYYCQNCTSARDLSLSSDEMLSLLSLVKERSFESLKAHSIEESLHQKIKNLYSGLHEVSL